MRLIDLETELRNIVSEGELSIPPLIKFGHLSFNGLMLKQNDPNIQKELCMLLDSKDFITKYEIVSPGFINIFLHPDMDVDISLPDLGKKQLINVEFCSPNLTGPLHIGHCRGIIIGDVLSRLLKCANYNVVRESYVADQGNQVNQFIETVLYWQHNLLNLTEPNPYQMYYKGEYVKDIASKFLHEEIIKDKIIKLLIGEINQTLHKMNVSHNVISYESQFQEDVNEVIQILSDKNLIYEGDIEGAYKEGKKLILKTSSIIDEKDKVLKRADGHFTYFAFDIGYHLNKHKRKFINNYMVIGEDHHGHVNKLLAVLKELDIDLQLVVTNNVMLEKDGEILSLSKRNGVLVTINEILDLIHIDTLRWIILSFNARKVIKFDIARCPVNDPVFYFFYAINRIAQLSPIDHNIELIHDEDYELLSLCLFFPIIFRNSVKNLDVHKLFEYAVKLAKTTHRLFEKINRNEINCVRYKILQTTKEILNILTNIFNFESHSFDSS